MDKPIIVSLKANTESNYEFSVEDFGVGLDDTDVKNIISKYGKSIAREEANSLGMMGLGFKSPLAYCSSFYFIARKDGMERKYMMYEGEDGNAIDFLNEKETEEGNGVKVIVPIKYSDRKDFVKKIREQLAYFESVYFDVPGSGNGYGNYEGISNGFSIFRSEDFQHSEMGGDTSLHICLDNVYYPIDWAKLGISRIDVPVGLRFGLSDGIFPVPSRESLRYTQEAKKTILAKIRKIADYFVNKYNESINGNATIDDVFEYYNNRSKIVTISGTTCDIVDLIEYSSIKIVIPKMKGIELLDLETIANNRQHILGEYQLKYKSNGTRIKESKYGGISISDANKDSWLYSEGFAGVKKEYFRALISYNKTIHLVRKERYYKLEGGYYDRPDYCKILNLKNHPKSEWRQRIKEFQYIQGLFISRFSSYDELVIPEEWIDARKRQRTSVSNGGQRKQKLSGEIIARVGSPLEKYTGNSCKFVAETYKFEKIPTLPYLHVYTSHDNLGKLDPLYHITYSKQKMRVLTFSDREIKNIEKIEIHNLISYEKFMKGENKPFKRIITAYLIERLISKYYNTFSRNFCFRTISVGLQSKLEELKDYKYKNFINSNDDIYKAMLEVAEANNLFDLEIYSTYMEIKSLLEKLPFIETITKQINSYERTEDKPLIDILRDLFKYYKYRIDYKNYKIKLNEDEHVGELTGEVIEELEQTI